MKKLKCKKAHHKWKKLFKKRQLLKKLKWKKEHHKWKKLFKRSQPLKKLKMVTSVMIRAVCIINRTIAQFGYGTSLLSEGLYHVYALIVTLSHRNKKMEMHL